MTIPTDRELSQAYSQGYQDGRKGLAELVAALQQFVDAAERGATTFFNLRGSCLRQAHAALNREQSHD